VVRSLKALMLRNSGRFLVNSVMVVLSSNERRLGRKGVTRW
jgi:hypothetical protein